MRSSQWQYVLKNPIDKTHIGCYCNLVERRVIPDMSEDKEKILSNIAKAVNSAPDKQQYFLGLAEGMALMAEEKKAEKPDGKKGA